MSKSQMELCLRKEAEVVANVARQGSNCIEKWHWEYGYSQLHSYKHYRFYSDDQGTVLESMNNNPYKNKQSKKGTKITKVRKI
jgi:hypothetical protein